MWPFRTKNPLPAPAATLPGLLPAARLDYRREAGALHLNSIVLACIKWQCRTFPEAPLMVQRRAGGGPWQEVPGHPLTRLLAAPNPWWDGTLLWSATLLSLATQGNAYWHKVRSATGLPARLDHLPAGQVRPVSSPDERELISGYVYQAGTREFLLPVRDVIHLRDGIDPDDPRRGLSPLAAALREVCTDNEAATYEAALLRNMGIPGAVLMPRERTEVDAGKAGKLKLLWQERFAGERRGEPLVFSEPFDISNPGFTPEQLTLDKVRRVPEERISAAMGIPAMVLGLGAGLDRSTYNNYREAREAAYENNIIPLQRVLASQLGGQLLEEFPAAGDGYEQRIAFDLREVRVLQADANQVHARVVADYEAGLLTRDEARALIGA